AREGVCLGLRLVFFLGLSLFRLEVNTSFLTLLCRNWSWRVRQWVDTAARLREGNDIADGVKAAEQGDKRSQPKAMPPCGGAPYWNASSKKPNFSCASSSPIPMTLNTRFCTSALWIRMEPPPISLPLHTMS